MSFKTYEKYKKELINNLKIIITMLKYSNNILNALAAVVRVECQFGWFSVLLWHLQSTLLDMFGWFIEV